MIKNCPMRHENGNCLPAGGFCTANKNICEALRNAYRMGKAQLSQEDATSDLISRQAAIDAAKDWYEGLICGSINGLIKRLNALPPVQPEPKEGHWIWVAGDLECSKCHTRYPDLYPDYDNAVACPHCGYKMEVEHETN